MKRKISQADVNIALERLKSMAIRPTLDAIRTALGNQGSRSTIIKFLRLIEEGRSDLPTDTTLGMAMPLYLSRADFYEKVDGADSMQDAINYLVSEKSDPAGIISDLCVVIQRLRLEVKQCHSEVDTIRSLHKNVLDAMQTAIKQ
jgi:hypothetical protein